MPRTKAGGVAPNGEVLVYGVGVACEMLQLKRYSSPATAACTCASLIPRPATGERPAALSLFPQSRLRQEHCWQHAGCCKLQHSSFGRIVTAAMHSKHNLDYSGSPILMHTFSLHCHVRADRLLPCKHSVRPCLRHRGTILRIGLHNRAVTAGWRCTSAICGGQQQMFCMQSVAGRNAKCCSLFVSTPTSSRTERKIA